MTRIKIIGKNRLKGELCCCGAPGVVEGVAGVVEAEAGAVVVASAKTGLKTFKCVMKMADYFIIVAAYSKRYPCF